MTAHIRHLASVPFAAIKSGNKVIESRLYDEKRRQIQLGDELLFVSREDPNQTVEAKVVGLLRYETFKDLFSHNKPEKFGNSSVDSLEKQISEFYNLDEQKRYGVLGIEFALILK